MKTRCYSDIHGPGDDECYGDRCKVGPTRSLQQATRCARHGDYLSRGICWECEAEAEIQRRDREDAR